MVRSLRLPGRGSVLMNTADRGGTKRPTLLPRVDFRGTGRTHDYRDQPEGTTAFVRAPRATRQADRGRRVLLCGTPRGRGEGREAAQRVWLASARRVRAQ